MKIVCDANMPFAGEAFGTLGDVVRIDGRAIRPADVREADLLITRSTTRVDRNLLEGSRVRFYATATIGHDHVDADYLRARGISWTTAAGCNAESVAQYLTAALLTMAGRLGFPLKERTLGMVGVGHVGTRVAAKARALGMNLLCNDPPRKRDPEDAPARDFVPLDRLLTHSDIVTLHVPLNPDGIDRTAGLCDAEFLAKMRPGAILVNASRGEVTRTDALLEALASGSLAGAVIDTWENEPRYRADLLERVAIGTPHIAGHSFEGKVNGTILTYRAACRFLGRTPVWEPEWPTPPLERWTGDAAGRADEEVLRELVAASYDIAADDAALRRGCVPDVEARAAEFDRLRKHYPMRREFSATTVTIENAPDALLRTVQNLGFQCGPPDGQLH